jgi:hypothetical protein
MFPSRWEKVSARSSFRSPAVAPLYFFSAAPVRLDLPADDPLPPWMV